MTDWWLLFPSSFNVRICISCLASTCVGCGTIDFESVSSLIGSRFVWDTRLGLLDEATVDWLDEDTRERVVDFVEFPRIGSGGGGGGGTSFDDTLGNLKNIIRQQRPSPYLITY
jgi:hypothetical protein